MFKRVLRILPHERLVADAIDTGDDMSKVESHSSLCKENVNVQSNFVSGELPVTQLENGEYVEIREFRDEAERPWWKFFDEYEYREISSTSASYKWYQWFQPEASVEEKKLLCKLDILIAFYSFVGYWIKYIDSLNLNNAYVSNMKEDLNMQGNDLIDTQVLFTVGSTVFLLPWVFLLPRIPINYALFCTELGWALFTVGLSRIQNVTELKALRFFVGAFEAAYFPCIHYLLASWYTASEISRRGAFFYIGQFLGVLTSGLIASACFSNLNGVNGLAGWRWLFIVDGVMSVVVAILALLFIPGTPAKCYSYFLTDDEILLARRRMKKNGTDTSSSVKPFFDKSAWKKVFGSWQLYLLTFIQMFGFNTNNTSSGSFVLWLKSLDKYSIGKINDLSTIPPALGIIYIVIICFGADLTRKRFGFIILSFIMNFIGNVILAVWDVPYGAKWFAFCFGYWSWSQSSVFNPMISDFFRKDSNVRAIGWMFIYIMGVQSSAWVSKLIWPTVDSPRFLKGFTACAVFSIAFIILLCVCYCLYKRDERKEALENGIFLYNSKLDEIPEIVLKHERKSSVDKSLEGITSDSL